MNREVIRDRIIESIRIAKETGGWEYPQTDADRNIEIEMSNEDFTLEEIAEYGSLIEEVAREIFYGSDPTDNT